MEAINQVIKGGLEKYPSSKLFDQSQYCASSTERLSGEYIIDITLIINIANKSKKVFWIFNSKMFFFSKINQNYSTSLINMKLLIFVVT